MAHNSVWAIQMTIQQLAIKFTVIFYLSIEAVSCCTAMTGLGCLVFHSDVETKKENKNQMPLSLSGILKL